MKFSSNRKVVYTSDMHFDEDSVLLPKFKKGCKPLGPEWMATCRLRENFFIQDYVKEHKGSLLIIAGDVYRDIDLTIAFAKRLDKLHIEGFFVLGNHEFIGNHTFTRKSMADYCKGMTYDHEYFKFLCTGLKYFYNTFCVIGDAAWPASTDAKLYKEWNIYAESTVSDNKDILVITHFPMKDVTKYITSFQIFGHLHTASFKNGNHFSHPYLENQSFGVIHLGG